MSNAWSRAQGLDSGQQAMDWDEHKRGVWVDGSGLHFYLVSIDPMVSRKA